MSNLLSITQGFFPIIMCIFFSDRKLLRAAVQAGKNMQHASKNSAMGKLRTSFVCADIHEPCMHSAIWSHSFLTFCRCNNHKMLCPWAIVVQHGSKDLWSILFTILGRQNMHANWIMFSILFRSILKIGFICLFQSFMLSSMWSYATAAVNSFHIFGANALPWKLNCQALHIHCEIFYLHLLELLPPKMCRPFFFAPHSAPLLVAF